MIALMIFGVIILYIFQIKYSEHNLNKTIEYELLEKKSEVKASLSGFLNKHEEIGLLMGFKLRIQVSEQIFEYTSYPTDEFIDTVIFNEKIFLIDEQMNQIISFKILTDQFVKTKSELDKFKKLLNK